MVTYLQFHRVRKLLRTGAVQIVVATDTGPVALNLGGLASRNEVLTEASLTSDFLFRGEPRRMEIPWAAVLLSQPLVPPSGPGTSPPVALVA
jgi:hypothetical protein